MQFIKKHYEKIILGVVLLGLTVALAALPFKIAGERQELQDNRDKVVNVSPKELEALKLERHNAALLRAQSPFTLLFSSEHNLFNPVRWQKSATDGRMFREQNVDLLAGLVVTKINPLYLTVTFDSTNTSGYLVKLRRETKTARNENEVSGFLTLEKPNLQNRNLLMLREVKGGDTQPLQLGLELVETGEKISVAPGAPFRRVDGYTVDLKPPEGSVRSNLREGGAIRFGGEEYTIRSIKEVAPTEYEIVLSARSTEKKSTKRFKL